MTTIVIDLDDPAATVRELRAVPGRRELSGPFADAIEAAADRRVIVLDVDALGIEVMTAHDFDIARSQVRGKFDQLLAAVREQLDSLTSPRPPEPTGKWALIQGSDGTRSAQWIRSGDGDKPWNQVGTPFWANWEDFDFRCHIEVLYEGVPS